MKLVKDRMLMVFFLMGFVSLLMSQTKEGGVGPIHFNGNVSIGYKTFGWNLSLIYSFRTILQKEK
ncbi:hypothetical protein [Roseivirga sp. UBA838]|uniref:hypothetical protein n=1 Tax=Roseivirga sp. UBA838 TaxID=1947393 RepID=UPI002580019D|nr:hypothetical protein [Roseivirga sp. UBA838]|tara:strand:+ start:1061 stop:1255 length:195 start_codon:yes stop_codon:yes gene_type:complete